MHTHGFDNVDPIEYAINKRNLYLSDVLMKHERQLSTQMSNSGETTTTNTTTTATTHTTTTANHPMIKNKNNNNNDDSAIDFSSNISLTGLLHQQQEEHDRKQSAISISNNLTDQVFQSD
jgi:hypothetical protein